MPYALCPMPYAHEYLIWELERLYQLNHSLKKILGDEIADRQIP